MGVRLIYNNNSTFYEVEYLTRIYEPYVFLFTDYGTVDIEFKGKEILTLFKTFEGAVKYFGHNMSVEEYYGHPVPQVEYVKVALSGKYKLVDITNTVRGKVSHNKVYGQFFNTYNRHPIYGEYIGWAYVEPAMVCRYCGGDTTQVDMDYLDGINHLSCVLSNMSQSSLNTI
jgi:hypothetical protein